MSAGWLVYGLLLGALACAVGSALEAVGRHFRLPTRWGWAVCLVATVIIVTVSTIRGAASIAPVETIRATVHASEEKTAGERSALARARETIALAGAAMRAGLVVVARLVPRRLAGLLDLVWLGGSGLALALLALVELRLTRVRRRWPTAELLGRRVRVAPTIGPAVVGVARPEIVVPRWLLARSADEQSLVLAHESEHLRGRDHLLLGAGCVAVALVPWNPAVWWMLARLRLAIEVDCDARVLRRGASAFRYGTLLIDLAGHCTGFRVGATALADEGSHLERRLLAMHDTPTRRSLVRAAALSVAAAAALLAACEAKVPTATEIDAMDAAGAERTALNSKMLDSKQMAEATFYVNGVRVTPEAAHAITANQIATIELQKANVGTPAATTAIRITTQAEPKRRVASSGAGLPSVRDLAHVADTGAAAPRPRVASTAHAMPGLILLDGVRIDAARLHALDPKTIKSIEVLKGAAAVQQYGPDAVNGVITVATR